MPVKSRNCFGITPWILRVPQNDDCKTTKDRRSSGLFFEVLFSRRECVGCCIACFGNCFCSRSNFCNGSLYSFFSHVINALFNHRKLMFLETVHSDGGRLLSELDVTLLGLIVNEAGFVSHHNDSTENRALTFFTSINIIKINSLRLSH